FSSPEHPSLTASSSDRGSKSRGLPQDNPRVASKRDINMTKLNYSSLSTSHVYEAALGWV
ncbi:hypothetical protein AVEN_182834-1, partial [Araneus ventricosus]